MLNLSEDQFPGATARPWSAEVGTTSGSPLEIYKDREVGGENCACQIALVFDGAIYEDIEQRNANAALIVQAVNEREELLAVVRDLRAGLEALIDDITQDSDHFDDWSIGAGTKRHVLNARALLARIK